MNGKHDFLNPYLGAVVAFFGGLSLNDWAAILGIVFGFLTYVVNWYYRRKEYKLKEQEHMVVVNEENSNSRRL